LDPQTQWFREAKLGMFVHFGIYALLGRGEWVMYNEDIRREEYEKLTRRFNPSAFDADEWVQTARRAGCRYITVTAKHHDGFCLFDSALTDYKITNTPFARDLIGELVDACHRGKMRIIFYYSQPDWHHPNFVHRPGTFKDLDYRRPDDEPNWPRYLDYYQGQVKELCTNYGSIDGIWFDGVQRTEKEWQGRRVYEMIKSYQPAAVVNDRAGYGDFFTPERSLAVRSAAAGYMVEACQSVAKEAWGYRKQATLYSSPHLLHSMLRMVGAGGNYLLNVGPKPDGSLPQDWVQRLYDIGAWLGDHGKAVYGTDGCPLLDEADDTLYTRSGKRAFLQLLQWPESDRLQLRNLRRAPVRARMLKTGQRLGVDSDGEMVVLTGLPASPPDAAANVVEMTFDTPNMFRPAPQPPAPVAIECAQSKPLRLVPQDAVVRGFGLKGSLLAVEEPNRGADAARTRGAVFGTSWQPDQKAEWTVRCPRAMQLRVAVELSCPELYAGGTFTVKAAGQTLRGQVSTTDGFREVQLGVIRLPRGESTLTFSPEKLNIAYYFAAVRQVILRPVRS